MTNSTFIRRDLSRKHKDIQLEITRAQNGIMNIWHDGKYYDRTNKKYRRGKKNDGK